MAQPLVSICIPAYLKPHYVVRCIQSILQQSYRNVEVVISDDSPGEDIKEAIAPYQQQLNIRYFHNLPALKSPRNWNNAIDQARGELVLLLHQDDWFHAHDAISSFVAAFNSAEVDFVFCRNTAVDEQGRVSILQERKYLLKEMAQKPHQLLLSQIIGPPSNTMLRRSIPVRYDEQFIWVVDVDYYARLLQAGYGYRYIDRHLVSIGLHPDQTTVFCRTNSDIIFRENILLAAKVPPLAFSDPVYFDYFWRLLRNYKIRNLNDIAANGLAPDAVPPVIRHILRAQQKLNPFFLRIGLFSKAAMIFCFLKWQTRNKA